MIRSAGRRLHRVLAIACAAVALAGCATGPRPTLGAVVDRAKPITRQGTGDPIVDALLLPLEGVDTLTFTATYSVTMKTPADAPPPPYDVVVAQMQPFSRSITIGDTVYLRGAATTTCAIGAQTCAPGVDNTKTVPPLTGTYFDDDVKALIRDAFARRVKAVFTRSENIVDQEALCVTIPADVDHDFCILPSGQLAKVETPEVTILLTNLTDTADPARFTPPGA
jgi:hypothetical protein